MSTPALSASAPLTAAAAPANPAGRALAIGLAGIAVTALGVLPSGLHAVTTAWLVGIAYWTAIALGLSAADHDPAHLRRDVGHGPAPAIGARPGGLPLAGPAVPAAPADHLLCPARCGLGLAQSGAPGSPGKQDGRPTMSSTRRRRAFSISRPWSFFSALFFAIWIWLSDRLRQASFAQDLDGDRKWTLKNRFTAGMGIPLTGLSLTFAAIYWYHEPRIPLVLDDVRGLVLRRLHAGGPLHSGSSSCSGSGSAATTRAS